MKKSAPLTVAATLVLVALLLSALAWCFSDAGLSSIQRSFLRNYGQLALGSITLTYSDDWIVETASRSQDGRVLVYGFFPSGNTVASTNASLGLKRRKTGEKISFVMSPIVSNAAKPGIYAECLQTERCRTEQSFFGLNTPSIIVRVDGGEWVVLEQFATSILVLNPRHADLGDIRLRSTRSSVN